MGDPRGSRARDIYVTIARDGIPLTNQKVAAFTAPPPPKLSRVQRLSARRQGRHAVLVTFQRPSHHNADVSGYEVRIRAGRVRGTQKLLHSIRRLRIQLVDPRSSFTATVRPIGLTGRLGPAKTVRLKPLRARVRR